MNRRFAVTVQIFRHYCAMAKCFTEWAKPRYICFIVIILLGWLQKLHPHESWIHLSVHVASAGGNKAVDQSSSVRIPYSGSVTDHQGTGERAGTSIGYYNIAVNLYR